MKQLSLNVLEHLKKNEKKICKTFKYKFEEPF